MFQLTSERLRLIPLNLNHLQLLIKDQMLLEQALDLDPFGFEISTESGLSEEFYRATKEFTIPQVAENEADFYWFTMWLIVHRADNRGIGGVGIAGKPNEKGEVTIGYFVDWRYEGQGIVTESVQILINWIFENPDIQSVIADTLADGIASQRVLQKNGFVQDGTTEEGLRWRKRR